MYLQEEYYTRHGLDIPLILYVFNGSLLLRAGKTFILMTINWRDAEAHPGKYYIEYLAPVHDGYRTEQYFTKISDSDRKLEWDEYQSYLMHWSRNGDVVPVIGEPEAALASWELFVYCCDGWLVVNGTTELMRLIYNSIDESLSISERFAAYQECLVHIREYPLLLKVFNNAIAPIIKNYCHWLGQLVRQNQV